MSELNPYQSPSETTYPPQRTPKQIGIVRNIRAICILYILLGAIAVLAGTALFFDDSGEIPRVAAGLILVLGLCGVVSAVGVLRRKSWGVPFCQIVSAVYLLNFPIGTILGAYFLWNIGKVRGDFS